MACHFPINVQCHCVIVKLSPRETQNDRLLQLIVFPLISFEGEEDELVELASQKQEIN